MIFHKVPQHKGLNSKAKETEEEQKEIQKVPKSLPLTVHRRLVHMNNETTFSFPVKRFKRRYERRWEGCIKEELKVRGCRTRGSRVGCRWGGGSVGQGRFSWF